MIHELKSLKLPGSILRIEIVDNKIYILDNKFILLIYCNDTFILLEKYFLLDSQDDKHIYENTLAISQNLHFYHSLTNSTFGSIFTLNGEEVTQSLEIELHHRNISYAKFSNDSKVLLIGGEDGRTCFYDLNTQRSCFSFDARSDFISSACFSHSDKLVCVGAYDKAIKIHDISQHKVLAEAKVSDTPEDILFFDNDTGIIGITRDRRIFSYKFFEEDLKYANMLFGEWPTSIVKIGFNHVLVGTKGDILYIFNMSTLTLVRRFQVDNFGVKTLQVFKDILYIGYSNGELKIIDTNYLYGEFKTSLKLNKFAKATSLLKDNIFLITKKITKKYDAIWDQVLDMAKDVLSINELEKAQRIVKPFLWDKRKKDEFMALQINIGDIKHFESLVEQNSHVIAFKFADEKEHLKSNSNYETIETDFNKKFQVAKNLFSKDTMEDIQSAKNIITPYLKIESKKALINNLMSNYKIFARSTTLIKARNFKVYFRLVENNEFLKDESLYSKIVEIGNQTYSKLLKMEQVGDYDKAAQIANYLADFIPFNEQTAQVNEIIESKKDLISLIQTNNVKIIYDRISESNELELSSIFSEYHKVFQAKKEEATLFANEGQTPQVKETLENHLNIDFLINSVAAIFKLSYLVELENAINTAPQNVNISASLERYAILYGIDDEVIFLSKRLNFFSQVPDYPPNPVGFKTNNFYDHIVVNN